jgi:hypothetical protein
MRRASVPPPVRVLTGEFLPYPGDPTNTRFELVPGALGGGYVVLLDHMHQFAYPFMTREGAMRSLAMAKGHGLAFSISARRSRHTYRRYTGA